MASANPLLMQTAKLCSCHSRGLLSIALRAAEPSARRASSSNSRWKQRQGRDAYARDAKVKGLKSRAAFKLLEMDSKYKLFKSGQTVVDLGYAPGSWSQVAQERTRPRGQVIGIDLIPAQPPKGVATFQGDFLSPVVQKLVKDFIIKTKSRDVRLRKDTLDSSGTGQPVLDQPSYIDTERHVSQEVEENGSGDAAQSTVDVVLSDMSEPWPRSSGYVSNTLTNPFRRLMNTSGMPFRDHAGSMDLCTAALQFASDTLKPGGHFVCKFYQGAEDKKLEGKLKRMFGKVFREKPDSSRSESKEAYFVALRRKQGVLLEQEE
ncbi:hypothetical protein E4U55_006510 [Claviceps digitariae]|nr:hypothetical protein E4U55_006510 [Claviceps digitariae]